MRPLFVLLLVALPALAAPVPKALTKPPPTDGEWRLVGQSAGGEKIYYPETELRYWTIRGEYITYTKPIPADLMDYPPNFKIIDSQKPEQRMWGVQPAVYRLDGDKLYLSHANDGRKTHTDCVPAKGTYYYVLERVKDSK